MNNELRRVVFDGYYGMRNAGDDAFCVVSSHVARRYWGAKDVSFVGKQEHLPKLPYEGHGLIPPRPLLRGHTRFAAFPAMIRARRVVHVGGSRFSQSLKRHRDQTILAGLGLLELHAVGISIGPFKNQVEARQTTAYLRRFKTISTRDHASRERLADLDPTIEVRPGFDVAVLLPDVDFGYSTTKPEYRVVSSDPVLGVSVCHHETFAMGNTELEYKRLASTVELVRNAAKSSGALVRLLVFNDHPRWGELELSKGIARELSSDVRTELVVRTSDVRDLLEAVGQCTAVIATRLHAGVFAYARGVPFAQVAYHQKCADFAHRIGLPDALLFPAEGPNPSRDVGLIHELLIEPDPGPQFRAQVALDDAKLAAMQAFQIDMVGGTQLPEPERHVERPSVKLSSQMSVHATLPDDVMAIVLTFRRERLATQVVRTLIEREGFSPQSVVLVINGEGGLSDKDLEGRITSIRLPENLGPAGGFRVGLEYVSQCGARWAYVCEDDISVFDLPTPRVASLLTRLAESTEANVGGVAAYGRILDHRTGRTRPYAPQEQSGLFAEIDVAAWGASLISCDVIKSGVLPDPGLFFGYEDFDFWLSARRRGYRLLVDIETARSIHERIFSEARERILGKERPTDDQEPWRKYYEARNFIFLSRRHGRLTWLLSHLTRTLRRIQLAPTWQHRTAAILGLFEGVFGKRGKRNRYLRTEGEHDL